MFLFAFVSDSSHESQLASGGLRKLFLQVVVKKNQNSCCVVSTYIFKNVFARLKEKDVSFFTVSFS